MSKRVIIIGPAHPLRGGLASYNERLAREFQSQGHRVSITTFSLQYPGFLFPGTTQFSSEPAPADMQIDVDINSVNPLNWFRVGYKLKKQKPDLIVVRYWLPFMGPCLGTILRIVRSNAYTKVVCIADNIIPHETRPGDSLFTKYFLKPIDAFITMSEKVMADLKQLSPRPARFVSHPLYDNFGEIVEKSVAQAHLQLPSDKRIVLFFGFIRAYKGLDILFDAIAILKKNHLHQLSAIRFLIAGEFYEDSSSYLAQAKSLNIEEYILWHTHFIPDSEVKYYLSAADCVVQPYKHATQSGVTPLAYHFEVPMLVTRVGALASMVPPGVGLIAEPSADDIALKLLELLNKDVNLMQTCIRSEKNKYTWSNITDAVLSLAHTSTL